MIKFYKGLREKYSVELHGNGIYFATDTYEIIHNNHSYSGLLAVGKSVSNITLAEGVMTVTYSDNTTTTIEVGSGKYKSNIEDKNVAMTTKYGDYVVGTKVSALEGKTYDELFDGILFPSVNPTKSGDPAVTGFALNNAGPVKLGSAVVGISEAGLDRKKWSTYNNNAPYAGEVVDTVYTFTINGSTYSAMSDLNDKVYTTLGSHTYKAVVSYGAGIAPKNNKGVEQSSLACPAGSKEATRTINVTAPWYASTATAGVLTEQALISWNTTAGNMTTPEFTLKPHTAEAPQKFKTPRRVIGPKSLGRLQQYSTVAKAFENVDIADWDEVETTEKINEIDQTYYTYTYKGAARGEVKLIVKF